MNYIELINNFWRLDLEARFAPVDVHLYFYLLHVCNSLAWRNPFYHSNGQLTGALGISEKTLIGAKKRLQEMGLIEVESGDSRRKSSLYYLLNPCNNYSSSESRSGSNAGSRPESICSVLNKQKETKQNIKINTKETTVSMHTPDELNIGDFKDDLPPSGTTIPFEDETPLNDKFEVNNYQREAAVEKKKGCVKKEKTASAQFQQPTLEEVTEYCKERKNDVNPEQWLDFYTSNGWKVGKNPMKDWKAAVRTWERNGIHNNSQSNGRKAHTAGVLSPLSSGFSKKSYGPGTL